MNTKPNDYSLLREFNLEQAQNGETFTYHLYYEKEFKYLSNSKDGSVFAEDSTGCGTSFHSLCLLKMKPLYWIEGKPVYKGDKLWYKSSVDSKYYQHEADNLVDNCLFDKSGYEFVLISKLTFDKPRIHQELIDAYDNGSEIQFNNPYYNKWEDCRVGVEPAWVTTFLYRIKPKELKKKSGWINLWKAGYSTVGVGTGSSVYSSKEDALAGLCLDGHLGTIEIHWEE